MENSSHSNSTITLHLYIPPFKNCQLFDQVIIFFNIKNFLQRTGKRTNCTVTFYTKFGEKVNYNNSAEGVILKS